MKDQYVGDVNDYVKYGLLRALRGVAIGLWWMLTPADGSRDGSKTSYLRRPEVWRPLDPILFDLMEHVVTRARRSIRCIQESGLFPHVRFWDEPVPAHPARRVAMFQEMLCFFSSCDLVFFDPDMGFQVPSVKAHHPRSIQYLMWPEVRMAVDEGFSVVCFQYFPRRPRLPFVSSTLEELSSLTHLPTACLWTPSVAFFVASQPGCWPSLESSLRSFARTWRVAGVRYHVRGAASQPVEVS